MNVFVDGAAGTVGASLLPYLWQMQEQGALTVQTLAEDFRKDTTARQELMRQADLVVLCLPEAEISQALSLVEAVNPEARILDASAAHRCDPTWVYGLPEVVGADNIKSARRVANPGCFATASILAGRPLVAHFGMDSLVYQGITGYSAGGRKARPENMPALAQFGKAHRHLPEIQRYTKALPGLTTTIGPWRQGMLVQVYVPVEQARVLALYQRTYAKFPGIRVASAEDMHYRVDPQYCNHTNDVLICVAGQPCGGTMVAVVLDNLGKGSAGAAAENIQLMLF